MFKNFIKNFQEKSPKERFLLVIGLAVFLAYLVLGLIVIFLKTKVIDMPPTYRIAFGVVLIVYSFMRLFRIFNSNNQ